MDIYWIKDKRQCGPSTVPDVISLLQVGELAPDTLGWHAGCPGWVPMRELPALADFLHQKDEAGQEEQDLPAIPTPPADTQETPAAPQLDQATAPEAADSNPSADREASPRVYLPSPVARLLARFVDCALYTLLYSSVIAMRGIPYDASLLLTLNPLLWMPMLVLEAWMLSTWGTTPGKALMGIRVTTFGNVPRLNFLRALLRALMVFTLGLGLMISQLLPIMLAFEFWMLRRRGITPWDARNSTLPTQKFPATPSRYTLSVVILYVSLILFFNCMKPWLPGMVDDIGRDQPEMAAALRELMPEMEQQPAPAAPAQELFPEVPAPQDTSLPGM